MRVRLVEACALALVALSCQESQGPGRVGPDTLPPPALLTAMIVSNPVAPASSSGSSTVLNRSLSGSVYVSLPPGSIPDGEQLTIRTRGTGASITGLMNAGGMDPVSVAATSGDTLDIHVTTTGNAAGRDFISLVPLKRTPVLVRTDPPPARRDVPLNAVLILVFSEPIKPDILTNGAVTLLQNGMPVDGTLAFADPENLTVTFTPAAPLAAGADYSLVITQAIEDLSGETLEAPVTIAFGTRNGAMAAGNVFERVTPHSVPGRHSRFVMRGDGTFVLQVVVASVTSFTYYGHYASSGSTITFDVDGGYSIGPWQATGIVSGDSLVVQHNSAMLLAGFEDGTYVTSAGTAPLPPMGGRIAFVSERGGATIYTVNPDGSDLRPLTTGFQPAWSWDSRRIAFNRGSSDGLSIEIHVMNSDGSNQTLLGEGRVPSWSPDGSKIVFSTDTAIMVMNADGTNRRSLITLQSPALPAGSTALLDPAWSPDGGTIAFDSRGAPDPERGDLREVHLMDADGSNPRLLSQDGWNKTSPAWSPDGGRILVQTWDPVPGSSGYDNVIASYDVSSGQRVIHYRPHMHWLGFWGAEPSPDGRYIVYTQTMNILSGTVYRVFLLDLVTGAVHPFMPEVINPAVPNYFESDAAWSRN